VIVFVDMDGVVSRFVEGVARVFDIDPDALHIAEENGIPLAGALGLSEVAWRARIDALGPAFWLNLEPYEDGLEAWRRLGAMATVHAKVLTSPGKFAHSASAKLEWCRRHLGPNVDVVITRGKHLLARASTARTLLVDDTAEVTRAFAFHGGEVVLMPRTGAYREHAWRRTLSLAAWWEGREDEPPVEASAR
jgi:hypothetical protein